MAEYLSQEERYSLLIWIRLARLYHSNVRASTKHLSQWGLTAPQFDALIQIGKQQPLSQKELAEKLLVTKGNVTQSLARLEKAGLIQREQHWRTKLISLTSQGMALFQEVVPKQERFQAKQLQGLSKEEQKQLLRLLRKLQ